MAIPVWLFFMGKTNPPRNLVSFSMLPFLWGWFPGISPGSGKGDNLDLESSQFSEASGKMGTEGSWVLQNSKMF